MSAGDYLDAVLSELGKLTPPERAAVRRELAGHIEDRAEALRENGWAAGEAEERAAAAMGDPVETGRAIAKLYSPFWLWVERIAAVLLVFASAVAFVGFPILGGALGSVYARFRAPEEGVLRVDERLAAGNDVLRVYGIEGWRPGESCKVTLWLCAFDRLPFGVVDQNVWTHLRFETGEERTEPYAGGGGYGGEGATYRNVLLQMPAENDRLTIYFERFGEKTALELHLSRLF